jgi:transposase
MAEKHTQKTLDGGSTDPLCYNQKKDDKKGRPNYNFKVSERDQQLIMPPSIDEWIPDNAFSRFLVNLVDQLDKEGKLEQLYTPYRVDGWGAWAYHPKTLLTIILYAYTIGDTSSRRIAKRLHYDINFRFISGNLQPDFRTINDFRKNNLEFIEPLFIMVLEICERANLVKMGQVSLDGKKVTGNASSDRNRTRKQIARKVRKILEEARRVNEAEAERFGPEHDETELPDDLQTEEAQREVIARAMKELEKEDELEEEAIEGEEKGGTNLTKGQKDVVDRLVEAFNQVDGKEQEILIERRKKIENRKREEALTGRKKTGRKLKKPDELKNPDTKVNTTDPDSRLQKTRHGWIQGYNGQAVVSSETQIIVGTHLTQETHDKGQLSVLLDACERQAGKKPDLLIADAGYFSIDNLRLEDDQTTLLIATKNAHKFDEIQRRVSVKGTKKDRSVIDRMEGRLLDKKWRKEYKLRSRSEAVFGQMAQRGLTLRLRGIVKASSEWILWCLTHNLLKLFRASG